MTTIAIRRAPLVLVLAGVLVLALAPPVPATAGVPTDQLRGHVDRVLKVLEDPALLKDGRVAERRQAIRRIATDIFDFEEISRRALARHWQGRNPAEQREFVELMAGLLEDAYISKIETYSGEKIHFLGDQVEGELATVRTRIVTKQGTEIPVDYRMLSRGGRWLAYDVYVEGVSLVANYRTQFDRFIRKQSYADLVKTLRDKQAERKEREPARRAAASGPAAPTPPARVERPQSP
jgi:phospholipid transport system substrate-binding protein